MELTPGAMIAGRYRVDRKIGAGGMGEVWAGEHVTIGVRVALKTLLPAAALDRQIVARFRREAQLLGRVRSDRVARVVDFVEDRQLGLVLVMDLVEGEPLGAVLQSRRLGVEEAVDLGVDIVSALSELHRAKVVHRDLKPDNIILEPLPGGRRRAVIVDLGVGRIDAETASEDAPTSITQVDMAVGTLSYMAPEQLLSSSTATAAADVYAVGAILYRAISGAQVFDDPDDTAAARRKLHGDAPPLSFARIDRVAKGLAAVVARALQRRPEHRFGSAEEMLQELSTLQDLSRVMSFDLDAPTEEALPPSALAFMSSNVPSTEKQARPDPPSEDGSAGEPTRRMSRPPVEESDAIFDEETQLSPASQALPRAPVTTAETPVISSSPTISSQSSPTRSQRPTVVSPAPATVPVPMSIAVPPTVDEVKTRTIPLRTAIIGLVAALAAGTALGVEAHRLLSARPLPRVVAQPPVNAGGAPAPPGTNTLAR